MDYIYATTSEIHENFSTPTPPLHYSHKLTNPSESGQVLQNIEWDGDTDKPFICSRCGKGYSQSFTLRRHQRTTCGKRRIGSGIWNCSRCGRSYVTQGNLSRHQKFECAVKRKFYCVFCGHKFSQRCSLLRHLKTIHKNNSIVNKREPV